MSNIIKFMKQSKWGLISCLGGSALYMIFMVFGITIDTVEVLLK